MYAYSFLPKVPPWFWTLIFSLAAALFLTYSRSHLLFSKATHFSLLHVCSDLDVANHYRDHYFFSLTLWAIFCECTFASRENAPFRTCMCVRQTDRQTDTHTTLQCKANLLRDKGAGRSCYKTNIFSQNSNSKDQAWENYLYQEIRYQKTYTVKPSRWTFCLTICSVSVRDMRWL